MIGFKDMTFCLAESCKKFLECPRALTQEVTEAGTKWWGSPDFPVVVAERFDCYEEKE